jgi:hypothetical protein
VGAMATTRPNLWLEMSRIMPNLNTKDAEFLARYARDASRLQLALQTCQIAYDAVRESINKPPTQTPP